MVHFALKRIGCFGKIFGHHRHPMDDVTSLDHIDSEKEELKLKLLANLENKLRNRDYLLNQLQKRHASSEMPIRRALSLEHKLDEVALHKVRRRSKHADSPMARPRFDDFYLFSSAKHFNQFENWTRSIRTPTSLKVVNDFSSANFGQRRQKINHSYIGNNPVQSTTTGSRTATPGSKRPI